MNRVWNIYLSKGFQTAVNVLNVVKTLFILLKIDVLMLVLVVIRFTQPKALSFTKVALLWFCGFTLFFSWPNLKMGYLLRNWKGILV